MQCNGLVTSAARPVCSLSALPIAGALANNLNMFRVETAVRADHLHRALLRLGGTTAMFAARADAFGELEFLRRAAAVFLVELAVHLLLTSRRCGD